MATKSLTAPDTNWRANRRRQDKINKTIVFLILSILAIGYIFPFYFSIITSLKTDAQVFLFPPQMYPPTPQWLNYPTATQYIPFWLYMWNTFVICALTVIGTLLSCTLIAYGFSRINFPGRELLFIVYLSTIMLPGQVTMIPLYIFYRQLGWVGTIAPLVVPAFFGNVFYVFLLRQFFRTIPQEFSDAARIDGAGEIGILINVILPLCKPALFTVGLFSFLAAYQDFLGPLIYLSNQDQFTISLGLKMFQGMYGQQWQLMMAASVLSMAPVVLFYFLTQRTLVQGITMTGLKG
jgi:multiple sugar transport system permease protein